MLHNLRVFSLQGLIITHQSNLPCPCQNKAKLGQLGELPDLGESTTWVFPWPWQWRWWRRPSHAPEPTGRGRPRASAVDHSACPWQTGRRSAKATAAESRFRREMELKSWQDNVWKLKQNRAVDVDYLSTGSDDFLVPELKLLPSLNRLRERESKIYEGTRK